MTRFLDYRAEPEKTEEHKKSSGHECRYRES